MELLKHNVLPQGVFVSEDFLDMWIKRHSVLRPIVTLTNKMINIRVKLVFLEKN